jgi:hypothetical protein
MELALEEGWWGPLEKAPRPLRPLLVAAMRNLSGFYLDPPSNSRKETEARELMLADRFPYAQKADHLHEFLVDDGRADTAVATLRLSIAADDKHALWGADPGRQLLLLDSASEDAFTAGLEQGHGLVLPAELVPTLVSAIQMLVRETPAATLVVRDPVLRPLLRALLKDQLPELPVLTLSEVTDDATLVPLALPMNAISAT